MPSSSKKKPLVIVTRKLPDAIETRLMELFDTRLNADDKAMTSAEAGGDFDRKDDPAMRKLRAQLSEKFCDNLKGGLG